MTLSSQNSSQSSVRSQSSLGPSPFSKLVDEARFLRQWAGSPLTVGAIAPSGPQLANKMASFLDPGAAGKVVELGPGTGVVTQAILDRGIAPANVISIEYCEVFAALLRNRFSNVTIVEGDAYDLGAHIGVEGKPLAGIVSSLPLFTCPYEKRRQLIIDGLDHLADDAAFIQFSYALVPPVRAEEGRFTVAKTGWIMRNMPPARVWIYRKT